MWHDLEGSYLLSLAAAGRSPGTVRLHRHYIGLLARDLVKPLAVTRHDLEVFLSNPTWKPETRKSARTVVVMFYRWVASNGFVAVSPAIDLLPVSVPPAVARPAPEDVYLRAMQAAPRDVRLMLMLARFAGLRCVEIAAVSSEALDADLLYVMGKGGKTRIVPIGNEYLQGAIASCDGWLFPSPHGGHVTAGWVSKVVGRHLPGDWTAHQLRHAFATRAYANHPDVLALGKVLGHSKPETTMRYVETPLDALRLVVTSAA